MSLARRNKSASAARIAIAVVIGLLVVPTLALANWQEEARVEIPFSFVVDNSTMPSGEYVFYSNTAEPNVLRIERVDGEAGVVTLTQPLDVETAVRDEPSVAFERINGRRFLDEVHFPTGNQHWELIKGRDYLRLLMDDAPRVPEVIAVGLVLEKADSER